MVVVVPLVLFSIVVVIVRPWSTHTINKQWLIGMAVGAPSSPVHCCQVLVLAHSVALALPVVVLALWACVVIVVLPFCYRHQSFHLSSTP
jgi:hypothetical protein